MASNKGILSLYFRTNIERLEDIRYIRATDGEYILYYREKGCRRHL